MYQLVSRIAHVLRECKSESVLLQLSECKMVQSHPISVLQEAKKMIGFYILELLIGS